MGQSFVNECQAQPSSDDFSACLAQTESILSSCGIPHSMANGTLLGHYRDDEPLPCDTNVDLYYRKGDRKRVEQCLEEHEVPFARNFLRNRIEFCCPKNRVKVDLHEIVPSLSNKYSCAIGQGNEFTTTDLLPFQDQLPHDPEAVLNSRYGHNAWKQADDDGDGGPGCWRIGF